MTAAGPAIRLDGVHVRYPGGVHALRGATLEVPRGGRILLVGENGSGKSTVLRACLGLVAPAAGRVQVLGGRPADARTRVGWVPQGSTIARDAPATVLDVVLTGHAAARRLGIRWPRAARDAAMRRLEQVDLADLARRPVSALSGGQRQRMLLARALVGDPALLMLDEPTTGLDDASTARMMAIAAALPAAVTLLATTHDHRLQTMPGAGVIALRGGRVEGDGHAHAADGTCPIDHAPLPAAPTLDAAAAPDDPGRADDGAGAGARPPAEAAR